HASGARHARALAGSGDADAVRVGDPSRRAVPAWPSRRVIARYGAGMEQRRLGTTGLTVSCIGLGTAMWGRDTDEHEASDQLKAFVDAGGSFVDTADTYASGDSERVLGMLLTK